MGNKANHAQPIYQTVYNDLANRIIRKKINSLSSIVIARDYGINRNTADKIIRLLETNGLVYRIPRKGTFPVRDTARKVDSINIIYGFNEFTDQFLNSNPYIHTKLIEAVFRAPAASQCNVNLLFIDPSWSEETIREKFVSLGARAGFVMLSPRDCNVLKVLQKEKLPYVTYAPINSPLNYVSYDGYAASRRLFTHMIKAAGRRHIVFLGSGSYPTCTPWTKGRLQAYKDVLAENGIEYNADYVLFPGSAADMSTALINLLHAHPEIDGAFAGSFIPGQILIRTLKQMNLDIPGKVAVTVFHDLPEFSLESPSITAIRIPVEKIGQRIVEELLNMINFGFRSDIAVHLNTELILRESC